MHGFRWCRAAVGVAFLALAGGARAAEAGPPRLGLPLRTTEPTTGNALDAAPVIRVTGLPDVLGLPGVAVLPDAPDLPDAPEPNLPGAIRLAADVKLDPPFAAPSESWGTSSSVAEEPDSSVVTGGAKLTTRELDLACQSGQLHGKPCRFAWRPVLWESLEGIALQNAGNIGLDDETRHDLRVYPYWSTWIKCVHQFRYRQWRDDDDFNVDYIGHGLQGGIASSLFEQNDPMGRGMVYVNNGVYWRSRLKGMFYTAIYEVQWKIGPAGEASIGNSGLNTYYTPDVKGRTTNETGFQDFVDTPIVGFWWNVGEDALDRFLMPKIWSRTHSRVILSALFWLTPCKAAANVMAYKPLYYRDFPITPLR